MRPNPIFALLLLAAILPTMALASPTEASGTVTNVVDGDTFDIRIEQTDPRAIYEIERVRLADVNCPEMSTPEGPIAKEFARAIYGKDSGLTHHSNGRGASAAPLRARSEITYA